MSRRVVIGILILLIISVLGGIAALLLYNARTKEDVLPIPTFSPLPVSDPTADTDNDGLSNGDEKIWGTNPADGDTDKDGYMDGEEVQNSHNPTIASPNDKLPVGFKPNQNTTPLNPAAPTTTSFDSYFSDSVDVTGGNKNLTQEYGRTIPDKDKSPVTLNAYIANQPIVTNLPVLNNTAIQTEASSPTNIAEYIRVAGNLEPISDRARLTIALNDFFKSHDTYGFSTFADSVTSFQTNVKNIPVPEDAIQYHKLIIGYTELLTVTFKQIVNYPNDQVKALVAIRQLDAIDRQYYPLLLQEQERLLSLSQ